GAVAGRNGGSGLAVIAVSCAVPGRLRARLPLLRGAPALAHAVETRLSGHAAVRSVMTNAITRSVLVRFDASRLGVRQLLARSGRETAAARAGRNGHGDTAVPSWHALEAHEVIDRLATSAQTGLPVHEAERRRLAHGGNVLPVHRPKSGTAIVRDHLSSLPV